MSAPEIDRRSVIAGMSAAMVAGKAAAEERSARPNLVLFFLDEMRADTLACQGNRVTSTPNFDRLAAEGVRFADCHVQNPVCSQSRCSLLTGWPTSVRGHRSLYYLLQPEEPNLFRYLKDGGYDVFWFGKNDALSAQAFPNSVTRWGDAPSSRQEAVLIKAAMAIKDPPITMRLPGGGDPRETRDYGRLKMAIEVLERPVSDKPFCLFLPLENPHPPYSAPEGFDGLYDPARLPPLAPIDLPLKPSYFAGLRAAYGLTQVDDQELRKVRAAYYGQVSYADWLLGEFMAAMARTGRDRDTTLIVSSDHGDYAGDYGLVEKWPSGLETCLTQVPLLIRTPGGKAGHVVNQPVELFDVMATMLDLAGIKPTHTHFARSLVPQLHGADGDHERAAFSEGGYEPREPQAFEPRLFGLYGPKTRLQNDNPDTIQRAAAVRTTEYTYVLRPGGQSELYDRLADPLETRNLINSRRHATIREAMRTRLLEWYVEASGVPDIRKDFRGLPPFPPQAG